MPARTAPPAPSRRRRMAGALGNDPRPVFAAAGSLTLLTVATAWFTGLHRERAAGGPLAAAGDPTSAT